MPVHQFTNSKAGGAALVRIKADLAKIKVLLHRACAQDPAHSEIQARLNTAIASIDALVRWPWAMALEDFLRDNELAKSTYHHCLNRGAIAPVPLRSIGGRTSIVVLDEAHPWLLSLPPWMSRGS